MSTTRTEPGTDRTTTTTQLRDQMATLKEDVGQMGRLARDAASEKLDDVRGRAEEGMQVGRKRAERAQDALLAEIREHPLQSVALAVGVGFLVGLLNRR